MPIQATNLPIRIGLCRCGKRRGHPDPCYGQVQQRETIMDQQQQERIEALGPAERIVGALTTLTDHIMHNRPGMVTKDATKVLGICWEPVIWKEEGRDKVVYRSQKVGRKTQRVRVGVMNGDNEINNGARVVGEYRKPGLFPESAAYYYRQVAEVWKLDNEFAARWASWAFPREHRDLKVILCAFLLVQNRMGEPIIEDGEILFHDDDFRDVGEAMCLIRAKVDLNPKLLLRVGDVLNLPEIAEINRELGFGNSARNPARGRYYKVVEKWLRYREENIPMLEGLVKAGFRTTVMKLARRVGYKPSSFKFFEVLGWKQAQAKDGRRNIAIGEVFVGTTWQGMTEKKICQIITKDKPSWKVIAGMLPPDVGMTRAIVAAAVEAGSMSDKDLIIMSPTIEELGLDKVKSVADRWKTALRAAEDQRALNIAKNVKSKEMKEGLQDAADKATEKALVVATQDLRVYVIVDKSGSMDGALERAQEYLTKFLGGFPLDRLHVSVFNTMGTEVNIKAPKAAAVAQAFRGHRAGGGTSYAQGVKALMHHEPEPGEDALIIFVGDEEDYNSAALSAAVRKSGINPVAFGLLKVQQTGRYGHGGGSIVTTSAAQLGIPCFNIDENMFEADDPYVITRLLQNLIASTPVGVKPASVVRQRKTLVEEILGTELLQRPVWA